MKMRRGVVPPKVQKLRVISSALIEDKDDGKDPKIVSFFAKKAHGAIACHIIQNRVTKAEDLTGVLTGGYVYQLRLLVPDKPFCAYPTA